MPSAPIQTAFDALNRPVWFIGAESGDLVYSNNCARSRCGWRSSRTRALSDLAALLSLETEDGGHQPPTLAGIRRLAESGDSFHGLLTAPGTPAHGLTLGVASIDAAEGPLFVLIALAETPAFRPDPPALNGFSLPESVAHELNNIAASLFGFVELAAEAVGDGTRLLGCLDEIRIGVARVTGLSTLLETLAEVPGHPATIALRECLGDAAPAGGAGGFDFAWDCDPSTLVNAAGDRVRRALRTLAKLAPAPSKHGSRIEFTVTRALSPESNCSICGAVLPPHGARIAMIVEDAGLFGSGNTRPRRRTGRTFRELIVTATGHAAHTAGGHMLMDAAESSVSIVLPTAQ